MPIQPSNPTPDDILDRLSAAMQRKADAEVDIDTCKHILTTMRAEGFIGDCLEHEDFKVTWSTRSSWKYSPAIKQAQQMEQVDGTATKSTNEFWTLRSTKPNPAF